MKRYIVSALAIIVTLSLVYSGCSAQGEHSTAPSADAPDFTVEMLNGEKVVLSEVLKKAPAVLVFWTTWCPYCTKEIPDVEKFYREHKGEVAVFAINGGESKAKVSSFVQRKNITYPVALDSNNSASIAYKVRGVPTVVAISKEGKTLYYGHSVKEMEKKVKF